MPSQHCAHLSVRAEGTVFIRSTAMVSENNFPHMAGLASQSSLCPHRLVQDGQTQHSVNPDKTEVHLLVD